MAQGRDQHQLVKLSDSDLRLEAPEQDIRGLDVYDRDDNLDGKCGGPLRRYRGV